MNLEVVVLEDNQKYVIINKKDNYVLLANENDPKDMCIRKEVKDGNETFIESLENKEEFDKAINLFTEI